MKKLKLHIEGMHCGGCESAIEASFQNTPVTVASIDHTTGIAEVAYPEAQISRAEVVKKVHEAAYKVVSMEEV